MIGCHRYTYTYIGIVWLRAPNESRPFHSSWTRTLLGGVWNVHNFCETCTTSCKCGQLLWIRRQVLKHCKELLIRLYPHMHIYIILYIYIHYIIWYSTDLYCIIYSNSKHLCFWVLMIFVCMRWSQRFFTGQVNPQIRAVLKNQHVFF